MPTSQLGPEERPRAIETLLMGYAAGSLEPHLHALIESHLILSPVNRGFVRALEAAAAEEIEEIAPRPFDRAARDQVLGAIYAGGWYGRPRPRKIDPDLPEPLDKLIGMKLSDAPWRRRALGLAEHVVFEGDRITASLVRMRAGRATPAHTHDGVEVTLVLKGAFSDERGHYRRGDVAIADGGVDHRPRADRDADCICFAVTDAPLRLTGPFGRLLQRTFRG